MFLVFLVSVLNGSTTSQLVGRLVLKVSNILKKASETIGLAGVAATDTPEQVSLWSVSLVLQTAYGIDLKITEADLKKYIKP